MSNELKLNTTLIKSKIKEFGNQKNISEKLGISEAAISYWLSGDKLPDYKNLKALCDLINIPLNEAFIKEERFTHRFRKSKQSKVKPKDITKVNDIISALSCLLPFIENDKDFTKDPIKLRKPTLDYDYYQLASKAILEKLNNDKNLESILRFITTEMNTIVVPVLWGEKQPFCNALQITDTKVKISLLYINLNSKDEDIRFWLLHEAAHILAPEIESESFADALPAHILFPDNEVILAYRELKSISIDSHKIDFIYKLANQNDIAPYAIYKRIEAFIEHYQFENVLPGSSLLFKRRLSQNVFFIKDGSIDAQDYILFSKTRLRTKIFDYIKEYLNSDDNATPHFIGRLLNIAIDDAFEIFKVLKNDQ